MTVQLDDAARKVMKTVLNGSNLSAAGFDVLNQAAKARVTKSNGNFQVTKGHARGIIDVFRVSGNTSAGLSLKALPSTQDHTKIAINNKKLDPLVAAKAEQDLRIWDKAAGKTDWKKAAGYAAVGGGAGIVGVSIGAHQYPGKPGLENEISVLDVDLGYNTGAASVEATIEPPANPSSQQVKTSFEDLD
ncbi:hypothetical protein FRB93_009152 [Tulasnella sp. JGI-2019a]|nr:hypothetical protein FRB93_009152 [Tulasnella sp. JGI-2019a]